MQSNSDSKDINGKINNNPMNSKRQIITLGILTTLFGFSTIIPFTLAQTNTDLGVTITPDILGIIYTPRDFIFTPVNIASPTKTYTSIYNNPRRSDQDKNQATRDGTVLQVQDGRFKGGFEIQAQANNFSDGGTNSIDKSNLSIRAATSSILETLKDTTIAATEGAETYISMASPVVILNGAATCAEGRMGTYSLYPEYELAIPNSTPTGNYTTNITFTVVEQPSNCP
jgi:hypothetical protein